MRSPEIPQRPSLSKLIGKRYVTWLSLSLMSFIALMVLVAYEVRWVYPEIQAYFSQTGSLTGQQLATRSRSYLQGVQAKWLTLDREERDEARIINDLEIAYGLFDVAIYREEYACTQRSLGQLDALLGSLRRGTVDEIAAASRLLQPIDCLTQIEMSQLDRRGYAINEFAEGTSRHQGVLAGASLAIFLLGLVFLGLHERQLRRTQKATQETLAWMERAMRDPLTGIGNRSALYQDVMAVEGQALGLLLIDIDYFKQYNDALGHPQGDALLRQLPTLVADALHQQAKLYRLGGDEFAVLLPCARRDALAVYCQQVIRQVRQAAFVHPHHPHGKPVTLSLGGACFIAGDANFSWAYEAADRALYQVKTQGRDSWQIEPPIDVIEPQGTGAALAPAARTLDEPQ